LNNQTNPYDKDDHPSFSANVEGVEGPLLTEDVFSLCLGRLGKTRRAFGDRPAIRDRSEIISYRELAERIRNYAASLPAVREGALLGIPAVQSAGSIIALLAALAAGIPFVMIGSSVSPRILSKLMGVVELPGVSGIPVPRISLRSYPIIKHITPPADDSIAYVVATSGSSGEAKETLVTRRGLSAVFNALDKQWADTLPWDKRWTQIHPLTFGFSICEILGALLFGGELVIVDKGNSTIADAISQVCADGSQTVVCLTPSELSLLSASKPLTLPSHIIMSGEPAHKAALTDFFLLPAAQMTTVINTYAASETAGQITSLEVNADNAGAIACGLVGKPLPSVEVILVSTEGDDISFDDYDSIGEIYVGGSTIAAGYLDSAHSAERFVYRSDRRFFKTGDLGRWSSEGLYVLGRANRTCKLAGQWLNLDDIERSLVKDPHIIEAVVINDELKGPGLLVDRLHVIVVSEIVAERLRAKIIGILPIRLTVLITITTAIPRLPNGKVDLQALSSNRYCLPESSSFNSSLSKTVLHIWKSILGDGMLTDVNLFELGLDSLGLTVAAYRLSAALQVNISPAFLLDHPRIDLQIARLTQGETSSPVRRTSKNSMAQKRRQIRSTQISDEGSND